MVIAGLALLGSSPFQVLFSGALFGAVAKADLDPKKAKLKEEMLIEAGGVVPVKGPCPWCESKVLSQSNMRTIVCPACFKLCAKH